MSEIPDPIERGEARAERWAERFSNDDTLFTCSCGDTWPIDEFTVISPDPWGEPVCPNCFAAWESSVQPTP